MKTKFTLLIIAVLFFAASTQAQDRGRQYDRHDDYNYKTRMFDLQQKLNFEMNELDRAKACRDWRKVQSEKREIAEIRDEMRHINYRRWADQQNDFKRNRDYNSRF
jgi:hypothetical protein